MAQFRGSITGQRGEASRLGSKTSGLRTETNGWYGGVTVNAAHYGPDHPASEQVGTTEHGHDRFEIWGHRRQRQRARIRLHRPYHRR